jgi:glutamine amidotransferase
VTDIAIIDYGMGNLRSVANALKSVDAQPVVIADPDKAKDYARIIVPGVGAFCQAIESLNNTGMAQALEEARQRGAALLGICLGMQLFCRSSEEEGLHAGLGWSAAAVRRFPALPGLKVPHMGWDDVRISREHPLTSGIADHSDFYFVHSYYVDCQAGDTLLAGDYGVPYCAAFAHENVAGVQFHPEKSQQAGLKLLANFASWSPC